VCFVLSDVRISNKRLRKEMDTWLQTNLKLKEDIITGITSNVFPPTDLENKDQEESHIMDINELLIDPFR
jgi:hypothetical protein